MKTVSPSKGIIASWGACASQIGGFLDFKLAPVPVV